MDLFQRSIEVILEGQTPSGAYVACPNFPTYHYSWFRDGAFIAYAMNLAGEHASAARFHAWAAECILAREETVRRGMARAQAGQPLGKEDILHTRYTADGQDGTKEEWPNFQLDGFGTWLWALREHASLAQNPLPPDWVKAAALAADYLAALWQLPCFDCWEEFPDHIHTHTLAAIFGGLQAQAALNGNDHADTRAAIQRFVLANAVSEGRFVKAVGREDVDASLIGLAVPYRLVELGDARMRKTIATIEATLGRGGGLHRYAADTYYGGGEWVQLTAWLGWYWAEAGQTDKACRLLDWVEAQADANGYLPEQVPADMNDPSYYEPWRQRWGDIATPLLWSHAKYLILKCVLSRSGS